MQPEFEFSTLFFLQDFQNNAASLWRNPRWLAGTKNCAEFVQKQEDEDHIPSDI